MNTVLVSIFNKKTVEISFLVLLFVLIFPLFMMIFETNKAGEFSIKQAAITGNMTVYNSPGVFFQMFGDVFKYKQSDIIYFSIYEHEGKVMDESIHVRFNDGALAKVTANIRIVLPFEPAKLVEIHQTFINYDALLRDTVGQVISESIILTASLMSAEESYATKRAEFSYMAEDQVKNGIYLTDIEVIETKDSETGEITKKQIVKIQIDENGEIDRKESVLGRYGIKISQFVIKDIDYEEKVDTQIKAKQLALLIADSVKQDRLTLEEIWKKNLVLDKLKKK